MQDILKKFPDKEVLRKKLINAHSQVFLSDFIVTGLLICSIPWLSNFITKQRTGKTGFSAKFEMVDDKTLNKDGKNHEQTKRKTKRRNNFKNHFSF